MKSDKYLPNIFIKLNAFLQKHQILRKLKILSFFIDFFLLIFIKKPKEIKHAKKQIILVYNLALGDSIVWLCSLKEIRKLYPKKDCEITLICQKGIHQLFEKKIFFDNVLPFNFTESTINLKKRFHVFKLLRKKYYDIMLDPIGVAECTTNVFMSRAIVAKEKVTILDRTLKISTCPKWLVKSIYTRVIEINKPNLSLIEYYSEFVRELGLKNFKVSFEKPISLKPNLKLPNKYFIIFPSASTYLKCWPIERYVELTKKIYKKTGLILLLCGTDKDKSIIDKYKELLNNEVPFCDIIGKTKLLEFIDVIKKASLVITNDTSTYHIAVVCEIPVAIIVGGYTYNRYVKYNFERKKEFKTPCIVVNKMPCFDCDNRCPYIENKSKIWPCLDKVTIGYAWKKVEVLIDDNHLGGSKI